MDFKVMDFKVMDFKVIVFNVMDPHNQIRKTIVPDRPVKSMV
jgi:hypothetical protein